MMKNGWTGGQYSLFRAAFGAYLFVHFVRLALRGGEVRSIPALWDGPSFLPVSLIIGAVLSILLAIGLFDRAAAVILCYIWACLYARNPLISNPGIAYVGLLLLAHACLPPAPYGSWAARAESRLANRWRMPDSVYGVMWILMAVGYTYRGITRVASPSRLGLVACGVMVFEICFAPLALIPRLRPWLWAGMLFTHFGLADWSLGMVMLHLFTFDPAWVRPAKIVATETLFYDGHCGLCHRAVRFVLAEDRSGEAFRFAPLDSEAFRALVSEKERESLPDSLILRMSEGALLSRSAAVLHIMRRLGGVWKLLASLAGIIPSALRDSLYDFIARIRHRLFRPPADACPLIPEELRARFDH